MVKALLASIFVLGLAACGGGSETRAPVAVELNASQQFATERLAAEQRANQPIYIAGKLWPSDQPVPVIQSFHQPTAEQLAASKAEYERLVAARWAADPVKAAREDAEADATLRRVALLSIQAPFMDGGRLYPTVAAAAADGVPAAREALAEMTARATAPPGAAAALTAKAVATGKPP